MKHDSWMENIMAVFPHCNFCKEIALLDKHFKILGCSSKACVMGSHDKTQKCMTTLPLQRKEMTSVTDKEKATLFFKENARTTSTMTEALGIRRILPELKIRDYDFDPCGYSISSTEEGK